MRMLNAHTLELDEPEQAVAEICGQLGLEKNLLANAAGIMTCSYDFVETGIAKAICEAMPFDVVGCTTLTNAMDGQAGNMMLCLSVLTADDCRFATSLSAPVGTDYEKTLAEGYRKAAEELSEEAGLVFAFLPILDDVGGELMLKALDTASGGTPVFGTVASDFDTAYYSNSFTFLNGEETRDAVALLLVGGAIRPRFVVTATSEQNLNKQRAVITASQGSVLQQVNGMPTIQYLASIGLGAEGVEGLSSVPFVVDYQDGAQPVARAIYRLTEEGAAVCSGIMPEGALLRVGRMDVEDILRTANQSLEQLLARDDVHGLIMLPCLGRNMVLGMDPLSEANEVDRVVNGKVPWHLAYSGGEVCPVGGAHRELVNRFHNFTFIAVAI